MKKLIVNADDFGWSDSVNRGIIAGHQNGIVSSTSVMVNMPGFEGAVDLARANPALGVGLHLNLVRGRAAAAPERIPSLVDREGFFRRSATALLRDLWGRRVSPLEIAREWRAQAERLLKAGIRPTHLDSEKHLHALPGLAPILVELGRAIGVPAFRRVSFERLTPRVLLWRSSYKMIGLATGTALGLALVGRAGIRPLRAPDRTVGLTAAGHLTVGELLRILRRVASGISELVVHPGLVDQECREISAHCGGAFIDAHREGELQTLTDPLVSAACRERGIQLVDFGALTEEADRASVPPAPGR
ncbi:MAG: ChbG/HpnK family deacetylase [Candidatus Eisenbacteria sp.]|nr:ChbG/HpnK family deacetylase [Candidatus Eisenbacteria bacterium]